MAEREPLVVEEQDQSGEEHLFAVARVQLGHHERGPLDHLEVVYGRIVGAGPDEDHLAALLIVAGQRQRSAEAQGALHLRPRRIPAAEELGQQVPHRHAGVDLLLGLLQTVLAASQEAATQRRRPSSAVGYLLGRKSGNTNHRSNCSCLNLKSLLHLYIPRGSWGCSRTQYLNNQSCQSWECHFIVQGLEARFNEGLLRILLE